MWVAFNVHGSVHRKNILVYIQQDAKLHSLFYVETALHVSGGIITHHQERKQMYLQHLVFSTLMDRVKFTDKVYTCIKIRLKLQLLLIFYFCGKCNIIIQ